MTALDIYLAAGWGVWIVLWAWAVAELQASRDREIALWELREKQAAGVRS